LDLENLEDKMFALDEYQEELLVANTKLEDELLEIEMLL